ncbi:hypothetical protein pb186bvf_003355 [Paramecium bursaria]
MNQSQHFKPMKQIVKVNLTKFLKECSVSEYIQSYTDIRDGLLDYMKLVQIKLKLSENTYYVAVWYLDRCQQIVEGNQTALVCLWVASKAIEFDKYIPFLSKLIELGDIDISSEQVKKIEFQILKKLDWNLQTCTIYDQVQAILSIGILYPTDCIKQKDDLNLIGIETKLYLENQFKKYYPKVISHLIRNIDIFKNPTRIVVLAIILYLRKLQEITPIFPKQLQVFIDQNQIPILLEVFEQLCIKYDKQFSLMRQKKCISIVTQPTLLQCKSQPPPTREAKEQREPLSMITNTKLKVVHQKHQMQPLRKRL